MKARELMAEAPTIEKSASLEGRFMTMILVPSAPKQPKGPKDGPTPQAATEQ